MLEKLISMIGMVKENFLNRYFGLLVIIVFLLGSLSSLRVLYVGNFDKSLFNTQTIAQVCCGGGYYNARLREVLRGHPFIGNPYFIEYVNELSPAFFVADWIAAAPSIFGGLSLDTTIILNSWFWPLVNAIAAYLLLLKLGLSVRMSAIASLLSYLATSFVMSTNVSMQTILPFFLFFLVALANWLSDPFKKINNVLLIFSASLAFYVYTYLWQVVLAVLIFVFLFLYLLKRRDKAFSLLVCFLTTVILSIPLAIYTIKQVETPFYWESMERIGLVRTYIPNTLALLWGQWTVYSILIWLLSTRFVSSFRQDKKVVIAFTFFLSSGIALFATTFSNILTGRELELGGHIGRFVAAWLPLSFISYLYFFWQYRGDFLKGLSFFKKTILVVLLLLNTIGLFYSNGPFFSNFSFTKLSPRIMSIDNQSLAKFKSFDGPLSWLEKNISEPTAIWIDPRSEIMTYVYTQTKHYVLWSPDGVFQLVSDQELRERYLTANYFNDLTIHDIKQEYASYAGVGTSHQSGTHNRKVKLCKLLQLDKFGFECGDLTTVVNFKGEKFFEDMHYIYKEEIKPEIIQELNKFHVQYLLLDKEEAKNDITHAFEALNNPIKMFDDGRFLIYKLNTKHVN